MPWSTLINSICSKTMKHIGLLYIRLYILMSTVMHALLGMYKLLVRPHPECAALVWNLHLIRNISKLENAWMFALRQNYLWIRLFPTQCFIPQPSRVLYNHPSYINLLPTPIICICSQHHLNLEHSSSRCSHCY